jgi:hypothetical protein
VILGFSLSLRERSYEHGRPPLPAGEGWGEGEHTAQVVIPFTLRSLLLCHHNTGERARVAHRHHPGNPGSRQENRRFAMPSVFAPG